MHIKRDFDYNPEQILNACGRSSRHNTHALPQPFLRVSISQRQRSSGFCKTPLPAPMNSLTVVAADSAVAMRPVMLYLTSEKRHCALKLKRSSAYMMHRIIMLFSELVFKFTLMCDIQPGGAISV